MKHVVALLGLAFCAAAPSVSASENPSASRWTLALEYEHTWPDDEFGLEDPHLNSAFLRVERRLEHPRLRWLALGAQAGLVTARGSHRRILDPRIYDGDAQGPAFAAMIRAYVFERGRIGFYVEALPGIVHFNENLFETGTRLNGLLRAGAGVRLKISDAANAEFGYRRLHISNGMDGDDDNPAYDGNSFVFALGWSW